MTGKTSCLRASAGLLALALAACGRGPGPVDLLAAADHLQEATAAGQGREAVLGEVGRGLRVNDVLRRGFPAGPPGRLRFALDIPKGAHLTFACAIDPRFHDRPGVEFFVKVGRQRGREDIVWTRLLDPISRVQDRQWVTADVDLSRYAGPRRELVLETRGYEETGDPRRAWWGTPALVTPGGKAPLAIIYLVDTLRADHTGVYGYDRPTTPALDAFARGAVVFEQAIMHASWTKPSVASILTSLLPGQHRAVQLRDALDPSIVTVAQRLDRRGWATGAAIANSVIYGAESAFDRGFDCFEGLHGEDNRRSKLVDAAVVVDAALGWRRSREGLPTFLYVHTMDPHVPYVPPPPFDRMFEPHPTKGHPGHDPRTDYKEPRDRERMIAQYDGEIAYGDQEFGRFLRALKAAGVYDDALVIFIADHGEEFLDHGRWLHGRSVFDELIRVPLVVKFPGSRDAGRRVRQQVQGVDIVPTVLQEMGIPLPSGLMGLPLQQTIAGKVGPRTALSEISHRGFVAHGVRTEKDKYVRRFSPDDDELYFDLVRDPREQVNVIASHPDRVRFLRARGEAAMSPDPFRYVVEVAGPGRYELRLETKGWLEGVTSSGFGPEESVTLGGNGRWLDVVARPEPGAPREVRFTLRPVGVPVFLSGQREPGRPLRPSDVAVAESGTHPPAFPWRLPDIESDAERKVGQNLFAPPRGTRRGVRIWLVLPPGRSPMELDAATREQLRALGYLGPDSGEPQEPVRK
jgi:arylsulfatase A-like enzyme